jgi:hypothetical protein
MKSIATLSFCLLALAAGCGSREEGSTQYGKTLIGEFNVPAETLVKFEEFKPSKRKEGDSVLEATLLADSEEWHGPAIEGDSTANPYRIVVRLSGRAKEDGDAVSMWKVGWNLGDEGTRLSLLPGLTRSNLKAGQDFIATAVSDPISFKKDRTAGIELELVNAKNIEINGVQVQVWSGIGGTSFLQKFGAFTYLLIGAVMFVLWWFWFRRPKSDADL